MLDRLVLVSFLNICVLDEPGTGNIAQAVLELLAVLLPQPPEGLNTDVSQATLIALFCKLLPGVLNAK